MKGKKCTDPDCRCEAHEDAWVDDDGFRFIASGEHMVVVFFTDGGDLCISRGTQSCIRMSGEQMAKFMGWLLRFAPLTVCGERLDQEPPF